MPKTIKIACRGADSVRIDQLIHFQGKLKSLSEANYIKFRDQMLKLGFSEPISVWKDGKKHQILNGHQRLAVLKRLAEEEGFKIPPIPINYVDAKDADEARKKVLALTSQYGEMSAESLADFLLENDLDLEGIAGDFNFHSIDMKQFAIIDTPSLDPDRTANVSSSTGPSELPKPKTESRSDVEPNAKVTHAELPPDPEPEIEDICDKCGQTIIRKASQ